MENEASEKAVVSVTVSARLPLTGSVMMGLFQSERDTNSEGIGATGAASEYTIPLLPDPNPG